MVTIESKAAPAIPEMRDIPEHEIAIKLVKCIAGIKQSGAEPGVGSIP